MQEKEGAAKRNHRIGDCKRNPEGGGPLGGYERGEIKTEFYKNTKKEKAEHEDEQFDQSLHSLGQPLNEKIDSDVPVPFKGGASSKKGYPYQADALELLGPEKGVIEHVAAKDLDGNKKRHTGAKEAKRGFGKEVYPVA